MFFTDDRSAVAPQVAEDAASGESEYQAPFAWSQLALAVLRVLFLKQKDHAGVLQLCEVLCCRIYMSTSSS